MEQPHVIVVGGGAAGMLAAVTAASFGVPVTLVERNPKMGRKLYITGKGRCNVTNNCPVEEVLSSIPRNSRFLNSALRRFPPQAAMEWFVRAGVPLKTERGNRVFPVSDRAADVIDALVRQLRRLKVQVIQGRAVEVLARDGRACGVALEDGRAISGDRVILATGGVSYHTRPQAPLETAMPWLPPTGTPSYRPDPHWCRWWQKGICTAGCRAFP